MSLKQLNPGKDIPTDINVVIEIPTGSSPVKYEVDESTGILSVDRFVATAMYYPANYGFVPQSLAGDGDPVDVLVLTPAPIFAGSVIRCRPIGMLKMTDDSGQDNKVLAVPVAKLSPLYDHVKTYQDIPEVTIRSIEHFFAHYKDLEKGKWVKIEGWEGVESAHSEVIEGIKRYSAEKAPVS